MKKAFYIIAIIVAALIAWQWFHEEKEPYFSSFHYKHQWQKEGITKDQWELRNMIDSAEMITYMLWDMEDTLLSIDYPDCMQLDSVSEDSTSLGLMHMPTSKGSILISPYVYLNTKGDSIEQIADFIAGMFDSDSTKVTMKDMHDGYFYLQIENEKNIIYQQYVVDDTLIYCCGLMYPKYYQPSVKRLIDLVHQWNPK